MGISFAAWRIWSPDFGPLFGIADTHGPARTTASGHLRRARCIGIPECTPYARGLEWMGLAQTIIWRAVAGIGRGNLVVPDRYSSTPAAQARPSAIAQTISD
jgi:hypothetical protein